MCFRDHEGNHASYSVGHRLGSEHFVTAEEKQVPQPCLAQKAELLTLICVCLLAEGKSTKIYMDSSYAHRICHYFCSIWHLRGFKKSDRTPIQHVQQIINYKCYDAPKSFGLVTCQAHRKSDNYVVEGNNATDKATKEVANSISAVMVHLVSIQPHVTLNDIAFMQDRAPPYEKLLWEERGAMSDAHNLWRSHEGFIVALVALATILILDAHGFDHCTKREVLTKIKRLGYWPPCLQVHIDNEVRHCEVCAQYNICKGISIPLEQMPLPEGPFKHLTVDYVDMICPVHGLRYMLKVHHGEI